MFNLFKKKEKKQKPKPKLEDINHQPLQVGDKVESLRYNMGMCEIQIDENDQLIYFSLESGEKVSWLKMIDAATECQKVKKIEANL